MMAGLADCRVDVEQQRIQGKLVASALVSHTQSHSRIVHIYILMEWQIWGEFSMKYRLYANSVVQDRFALSLCSSHIYRL